MSGRLRWLAVTVLVLLAGYVAILAMWPEARPSRPRRSASRRVDTSSAPASQHRPSQGSYQQVSCEIVIPSADEVGPLGGCPKTQLGTILGVSIARPHGLVVGDVAPDGPAAKAGVQPGDQLGLPSECPSSTIGRFLPRDEAHTVTITITRRKPEQADAQAGSEPETGAEKEAAEPPSQEEPKSPP